MPISRKIEEQINRLKISEDEKNLMIAILKEEDKGTHSYKTLYEKLINEYIEKKEGNNNDID